MGGRCGKAAAGLTQDEKEMEEDFLEDMELMVEDLKDLLTDVLEAIAHHACQSEPACRRATEIQTTEPAGEGGPPPEARRVRAGDPRARRRFLWRVFPAPGEEPERQDSRVSKKAGHRGRNRRQRKTRDRTRDRRPGRGPLREHQEGGD